MPQLPCFGCGLPQMLKCFFCFSDKAKISWLSEKLILVIMKQSISASDAVSQQEALRLRFVVFSQNQVSLKLKPVFFDLWQ